jgi:hypothetical protein
VTVRRKEARRGPLRLNLAFAPQLMGSFIRPGTAESTRRDLAFGVFAGYVASKRANRTGLRVRALLTKGASELEVALA